jgi:hypothetical protein
VRFGLRSPKTEKMVHSSNIKGNNDEKRSRSSF